MAGGGNASTDLCDAAARGDFDRLRTLVERQRHDVNAGDYDQRTAIHLAASEGMLEVVRFLVEELGASVSPRDRWGNTPLDDATRGSRMVKTAVLVRPWLAATVSSDCI